MWSQPRTIRINGQEVPFVLPAGQGSHVTTQERPQTGNVPTRLPPLKRGIQREIVLMVKHASGEVTARQIAAKLGLKKTTWLQSHLAQLVADGYLTRYAKPYRPNLPIYYYQVPV